MSCQRLSLSTNNPSSAFLKPQQEWARLDEAQFRGELATKVHFLSAGSYTDELSLTCRESEDRSDSLFP
jgi:hypothetical protein